MVFPGHPSPPKTQARPVIASRPQQLGNFARISPAQRQTAPLRAARLTFAQLCPARCPSLTAAVSARVRVAASRLPPAAAGLPRLGDLPRAPRPAGVPTRDPDSPGFLKVSGIPPQNKLQPELREEGKGRGAGRWVRGGGGGGGRQKPGPSQSFSRVQVDSALVRTGPAHSRCQSPALPLSLWPPLSPTLKTRAGASSCSPHKPALSTG